MSKSTEQEYAARLALYESYRASGQTVKDFSRECGVEENKVKYAVRVHSVKRSPARAEAEPCAFREIPVKPFSGGSAEYTVVLANGRFLKVPPQFEEQSLRKLMEVLEAC